MREVKSKAENYALLKAGAFGNTNPSWETLEEFLLADWRGEVAIRSKKPGGVFRAHLQPGEVAGFLCHYPEGYNISPMLPDRHRTFQGEIGRTPEWCLLYSLEKCHSREAFRRSGRWVHGLTAISLVKHFFNENSYDDFLLLVEQYPDSVIEFSALSICYGTVPHRNVVIWEVRNY